MGPLGPPYHSHKTPLKKEPPFLGMQLLQPLLGGKEQPLGPKYNMCLIFLATQLCEDNAIISMIVVTGLFEGSLLNSYKRDLYPLFQVPDRSLSLYNDFKSMTSEHPSFGTRLIRVLEAHSQFEDPLTNNHLAQSTPGHFLLGTIETKSSFRGENFSLILISPQKREPKCLRAPGTRGTIP